MEILGHGIDIVELEPIRRLLARPDDHFLTRCFTVGERGDGSGRADAAHYFAGRLAAKEAVLKALGTGWTMGTALTDVEVYSLASGAPSLRLHRRCAEIAEALGIQRWWLSITHSEHYAVASAIGVGEMKPDSQTDD
jgi:holo-[acyl-carrier protein] synthase